MALHPLVGTPHYWSFTIILRHTTLGTTSLDEWLARRRDLYLTTNNAYEDTDIHASCKIRIFFSSKRAVADPSNRPRGRWDLFSTPNPFKSLLPTGRLVNGVSCTRKVLRTEKRVCWWTYLLFLARIFTSVSDSYHAGCFISWIFSIVT